MLLSTVAMPDSEPRTTTVRWSLCARRRRSGSPPLGNRSQVMAHGCGSAPASDRLPLHVRVVALRGTVPGPLRGTPVYAPQRYRSFRARKSGADSGWCEATRSAAGSGEAGESPALTRNCERRSRCSGGTAPQARMPTRPTDSFGVSEVSRYGGRQEPSRSGAHGGDGMRDPKPQCVISSRSNNQMEE